MSADAIPDLLAAALEQARLGLSEGGVPIGAVVGTRDGTVLAAGRNRGVQIGDHLRHAEIDALSMLGARDDNPDLILVTTMTPCWMCAGAVRFLGIGTVVAGDCTTWSTDALDWLGDAGTVAVGLDDASCRDLFRTWLADAPPVWTSLPASVDGNRGAGS